MTAGAFGTKDVAAQAALNSYTQSLYAVQYIFLLSKSVHLSKLVRSSGTVYSAFEDNRQPSSVDASNRFSNIATIMLHMAL